MEKRENTRMHEIPTAVHTSTLTIFRAGEVSSKQVIGMASEMLKFGGMVSGQEEEKFSQLNARFEEVLKAYEERGMQVQPLENKVAQMEKILGKIKLGETSKPRIAYPPKPPIEPFKAIPIIEIPDTPERP